MAPFPQVLNQKALILIGMATTFSPWLTLVLVLRSTQAAAAPVLVASASAPLIDKNHRATFLSLSSLVGRLAKGGVLIGLGSVAVPLAANSLLADDLSSQTPHRLTKQPRGTR